jgi:transcriptional regulator with XRE-family HTH domain
MDMKSNSLSSWLAKQLEDRGWSARELARRAGVSHTAIVRAVNGQTRPKAEVCISIAEALSEDPISILRTAGFLHRLPPQVRQEQELQDLIRALPPDRVDAALSMLRGLSSDTGRHTSGDRLAVQNPAAWEGTMEERLIGDTILRMDDPLRMCYEVVVDLMSSDQMAEFVNRLIQKAAASGASAGRNMPDVDVQGSASECRDDQPVPAVPGGNQITPTPDEE